jgi:uncharacterized membrane protein HdeD (DUF308 family)
MAEIERHRGEAAYIERAAERDIGADWGWFVALGAALIMAGLLAVLFPVLTTVAANVAIGGILLAVGVLYVAQAFSVQRWDGFAWTLLSGLVYALAGLILAFFPLAGILTLTVLVAALLIAAGIVELAWAYRGRGRAGSGWSIVNGLAALSAGAIIALGLPGTALWVLGLLVGINFALSGARFLALGLGARRRLQTGA